MQPDKAKQLTRNTNRLPHLSTLLAVYSDQYLVNLMSERDSTSESSKSLNPEVLAQADSMLSFWTT